MMDTGSDGERDGFSGVSLPQMLQASGVRIVDGKIGDLVAVADSEQLSARKKTATAAASTTTARPRITAGRRQVQSTATVTRAAAATDSPSLSAVSKDTAALAALLSAAAAPRQASTNETLEPKSTLNPAERAVFGLSRPSKLETFKASSEVLARARAFLPQLKAANAALPAQPVQDNFIITKANGSSSCSGSDDDAAAADDDDDDDDEEQSSQGCASAAKGPVVEMDVYCGLLEAKDGHTSEDDNAENGFGTTSARHDDTDDEDEDHSMRIEADKQGRQQRKPASFKMSLPGQQSASRSKRPVILEMPDAS